MTVSLRRVGEGPKREEKGVGGGGEASKSRARLTCVGCRESCCVLPRDANDLVLSMTRWGRAEATLWSPAKGGDSSRDTPVIVVQPALLKCVGADGRGRFVASVCCRLKAERAVCRETRLV